MKRYVKPSILITELDDIITTSAEIIVFEEAVNDGEKQVTMNLNENHLGSIDYQDFKSTN